MCRNRNCRHCRMNSMTTPATIGFNMIGAPLRATMGLMMPFTWHVMRQSAQMRHDAAVDMMYGDGPGAAEAKRRHDAYVRAFYGY
jgi:hypothetical protein